MTTTPATAIRGLAVLRERQALIPNAVFEAFSTPLALATAPFHGARSVVTTGVGSSIAHARYLAHRLRTQAGIPAWEVATGELFAPPGPEAREQTLVVFSQGFCPNARPPLAHAARYRAALLVTAAAGDSEERAAAVRAASDHGVVIVPLGCAPEYEVLLRLVGPIVGYAVAHRLAESAGAPALPIGAAEVSTAMREAADRIRARLERTDPAIYSDAITFVATDGYGALAHNLCAKVQEGMFLPWPLAVDALELAHGTQQEAIGKTRTFLALRRGVPHEDALLARARTILSPEHRWIDLEARLPGPLAIFEHEVMLNEIVLAAIAARGLDQCEWPGKGTDGPLYSVSGPESLG